GHEDRLRRRHAHRCRDADPEPGAAVRGGRPIGPVLCLGRRREHALLRQSRADRLPRGDPRSRGEALLGAGEPGSGGDDEAEWLLRRSVHQAAPEVGM
ncbi:MAG: hypothetical protein AVDCRST_MAG17-856, partial [uncultured Solirubrobacterales bacterium]